MGGSLANGIAGGTQRRGPSLWNGDARSLQTGSARMLRPAIWIRKLECPAQVMTTSDTGARGVGKLGVASGNRAAKARLLIECAGRLTDRCSIHLRAPPNP